MPFFRNVFKSREGSRSASKAGKYADQQNGGPVVPPKPRWEEAWSRKDVAPEEIQELIHFCTQEMKSRALDMPFLLLPFRPASDPSAARNFIRNFFKSQYEGSSHYRGEGLHQELRLTEPMVLCSIMKWCWSRLPGGVVTWDAYELFKIGESDSNQARHAFDTFIPLSVDSDARKQIIFDFFDLLSAVAARGKTNGLGGRKLSRMAGWWAFAHSDDGKGFDGGYRSWERAADAASHLFFAYLRSLSPDSVTGISGISTLPRSLQALVSQTEYPPQAPTLMQTSTTRVVMIVDSVSPTPFALLRRAKHFEYRDDDEALQQFSSYEDPVKALTDECRRVLKCISSTNQSVVSSDEIVQDASWSRFEDLGFSGLLGGADSPNTNGSTFSGGSAGPQGIRAGPGSRNTDFGRPTTPSWADFLSSGFADENGQTSPTPLLLPPDKVLPPIGEAARVQSSQSHMRHGVQEDHLEPGELASITQFDLDDTFWWVWMTSLAGEEPTERKAVFGRCALIETYIPGAKWLVIEEQVKGASPGPEEGAYIAEKKGRFSFTRRGRLGRRKSTGKKPPMLQTDPYRNNANTPMSKTSIGPDQHARIQAAAAKLAQKQKEQAAEQSGQRRARVDDTVSMKTNSVMTLQPVIMSEAAPAMKWAKEFDKDIIRAKYLGNISAGKGSRDNLVLINSPRTNGTASPGLPKEVSNRELPALPKQETSAMATRKEMQSPRPAPLPSMPTAAAVLSKRAEASAAAQVTLPAATPTQLTPLDDKPAHRAYQLGEHPALRKSGPERKQVASPEPNPAEEAAKRAWDNQRPSLEAFPGNKSSPNKLKKNTGAGGLRKLFAKKPRDSLDQSEAPQSIEPENSLHVPTSTVGRRLSILQKKPSPVSQPEEKPPVASVQMEKPEPVVAHSPTVELSPAISAVSHDYHDEVARPTGPRMNTSEQREADHAFVRFDQGPIDDMPAFVPEDSDEEPTLAPPQSFTARAGAALHSQTQQESHQPQAYSYPQPAPAADDVSERSIDLSPQVQPSQDRWAQIRRNAAERAARLSEEQSRISQSQSARTDEGETSGEETIESRVARIKARVAELTGNMDGQPGPSTGLRR